MTSPTSTNRFEFDDPSQDELDALLRRWHDVNAARAAAGRDALMQRLSNAHHANSLSLSEGEGPRKVGEGVAAQPSQTPTSHAHPRPLPQGRGDRLSTIHVVSNILKHRYFRAAASLALLFGLAALLMPLSNSPAQAQQIMLPDGGKLEAFDNRGNVIGPCALRHTDVHVDIAGPFSRVTLKQQYHNPYDRKIEAVYTFPLSNRGAVDRMTMTIGDRIIEAEMKERQQARQIYESARQAGHVASLLEQERPNIFTQSVANIEPKAEVLIEISYVEMLQSKDGEFTFGFPMVVAPRYVPGYALNSGWGWNDARPQRLPNELERRNGVILRAPAAFERLKVEMNGQPGQPNFSFNITPDPAGGPIAHVQRILDAAIPILQPDPAYRARQDIQDLLHSHPGINFNAIYADGSKEMGQIAADGLGHISGRWFYFEPDLLERAEREIIQRGGSFSSGTTQVPDGSRITPAPVRPPTRAGHDISLSVSIDTGGPAIIDYQSDLHQIICTDGPKYRNLGNKINLALKNQTEIPNRDFVLHWRTMADQIQESTFAYMPQQPVDDKGGYFTVIVAPPQRVEDDAVTPRELIFVLDTSGSMSGQPIEKAKAVMARAIDSMRARDTFNIITFSGDTHILWDKPRPNTPANRVEAQGFLASRAGEGGTEMMNAINAALAPAALPGQAARPFTPEQLANLPADGRQVIVRAPLGSIEAEVRKNAFMQPRLRVRPDLAISLTSFNLPMQYVGAGPELDFQGTWMTANGDRVLQLSSVQVALENPQPLRIVMFLTDGQVGNDEAIIQAVKDNARTTRVFSFGIGDSPNRNLLDGIAQAGRGEVEYVNLQSNPDAAVARFAKRIGTPVLTDIRLAFAGEGVQVTDTIPPLDAVPDLFDVKPLIIHGRYAKPVEGAAHSQLTIRGTTGAGPYERTIDLNLSPEQQNKHSVIATLWARGSVDQLMNRDLAAVQLGNTAPDVKQQVIGLGERYKIMTQYTSFVAVEKARITIAGRPMLVPVPIELPEGMEWEGAFGREWFGHRALEAALPSNFSQLRDLDKNDSDLAAAPWLLSRQATVLADTDGDGFTDQYWQQEGAPVTVLGQTAGPRKIYRVYAEFSSATDRVKAWGAGTDFSGGVSEGEPSGTDTNGGTNGFTNVGGGGGGGGGSGSEERFGWKGQVATTLTFSADPSLTQTGLTNQFTNSAMAYGVVESMDGVSPVGARNPSNDGTWNVGMLTDQAPGATAGKIIDINGDGATNAGDLLEIISHWGPAVEGSGTYRYAPEIAEVHAGAVTPIAPPAASTSESLSLGQEFKRSAGDAKSIALLGDAIANGFNPNDRSRGTNLGIYPDKTLTATVIRVERNSGQVLAEIDAGSRDGVKKDWVMTIGTQGGYIAKLRIINVDINRATGTVLQEDPKQGRVVQVGQLAYAFGGYDVDPAPPSPKGQASIAPTASVFAEQIAAAIAELVKKSQLDDAHKVVDALVQNLPQFEPGVKIRDLLNDQSITDAERSEKISALADEAMQRLRADIAQAKRDARLRRVVDQRLWPVVFNDTDKTATAEYRKVTEAAKQPEYKESNKAVYAAAGREISEGEPSAPGKESVTIVLLARDVKESTITELKSAGLKVQDVATSTKLVAGDIAPGKLADLALIESVRRIEPVDIR